MSKDGYYHPTPQDCGKKVKLPNPDFQFKHTTSRVVQMVITGPKGRMSLFQGCDERIASQAIKEFMEFNNG